jgi:choline dehydrogenase
LSERFDVIVVGGGSSGCVVAARLSEDRRRRVLLLEAGPDPIPAPPLVTEPDRVTELLRSEYIVRYPTPRADGTTFDSLAGRMMGGGSAINFMNADRPLPEDLEAWSAIAKSSMWSWDDVLPVLCRLETDEDFPGDPAHGAGGPVRIKRPHLFDRPLGGRQQAFVDACRSLGFGLSPDQNLPGAAGVCAIAQNISGGRRQSSAAAYLDPARARPNLTIRSDALVTSLVVSGARVEGVRCVWSGAEHTLLAGEVVLSAGVFHSPQILLLSGIGPPAELERSGVPVRLANEAVGANYQEHALVFMRFAATSEQALVPSRAQVVLKGRSGETRAPFDYYVIMPPVGARDEGRIRIPLTVRLLEHRTRGAVVLESADPARPPRVSARLLEDDADARAIVEGMRVAHSIARAPPMAEHYGPLVRPSPDGDFTRYVREEHDCFHHGVGTCAMGSVVDERLNVLGLEGLRVADASVIPIIPHVPTNLSCIMIGERAAEFMRR